MVGKSGEEQFFFPISHHLYRKIVATSSKPKFRMEFESPSQPADLFESKSGRFVRKDDHSQLLIYVDGACSNNGRSDAIAGWAVCVGPDTVFQGHLESHPDGSHGQTNNRAELQGAIEALKLRCWRGQGFDTVVIASDSEYVVKGSCRRLSSWKEEGWYTSCGTQS